MHIFLPERACFGVSDIKYRQITYETHANFRAVEDVCDKNAGKQRTMCTCICAPAAPDNEHYKHTVQWAENITGAHLNSEVRI